MKDAAFLITNGERTEDGKNYSHTHTPQCEEWNHFREIRESIKESERSKS